MVSADVERVLRVQNTRALHRRLVGVAITAVLVAGGLISGCNGKPKDVGKGTTIFRVTEHDAHAH